VPQRWSGSASLALVAAVVSVLAFAAEFFYWPLPDYVWQVSVGAAVLAILLGIRSAVRERRLVRLAGVVATALGLLVMAYLAFIIETYRD
jgi:hypothetical protein